MKQSTINYQEVSLSLILNEWCKQYKPQNGVAIIEAIPIACDTTRDKVIFRIITQGKKDG